MGTSSTIETLNLQNNKIDFLPEELFNCAKLTSLDLSHNRLKSLPDSMGKLSSLTSLDISRNSITSLPAQLGELSKLTSVPHHIPHFTLGSISLPLYHSSLCTLYYINI